MSFLFCFIFCFVLVWFNFFPLSLLINPDHDLPYFWCLCPGLNPSSKQATAESSWRERIRSSVVVCSKSMENRVTFSPPLMLSLSKKWNKTAHRTPPTDGKHCCLDERFSLPTSSSLFVWSWQVKKYVLLNCCPCLSSGALKWCQNRLLITAVYCLFESN